MTPLSSLHLEKQQDFPPFHLATFKLVNPFDILFSHAKCVTGLPGRLDFSLYAKLS